MPKNGSKPTPGKTWRKLREEGVLIRLPSGNWASLRSISPEVIVKLGRIPDILTPVIAEELSGKGTLREKLGNPQTLADLQANIEFVETVAEFAFVNPRIVADPQSDDEISIEDLSWDDKVFCVSLLGVPAQALERFRDEQARGVESLDTEQVNEPAAQPVNADQSVG
jgi:hypothetical protein